MIYYTAISSTYSLPSKRFEAAYKGAAITKWKLLEQDLKDESEVVSGVGTGKKFVTVPFNQKVWL